MSHVFYCARWGDIVRSSLLYSLVIQYLGMCLLFLHIRKKDDLELDLKEKILMIVFAPVMQMTFLAYFFYYWCEGDKVGRSGTYGVE